MAHDVFISHSTKDKTTADAVCAVLESSGVRCWIAPRDVTPGLPWPPCIIEAIKECRVMVLVFSTHANESPQIPREVERAVNYGVVILPFKVEDIIPSSALEFFIGDVHWLDAMNPPLEEHLQRLTGIVKSLLAQMKPRVAGPPRPYIKPVTVSPPIPDVAEAEPFTEKVPDSPVTHSTGKGADIPWQFGDTVMDARVSESHVEDETLDVQSSVEEAAAETTSPSPETHETQPSPDFPSVPKTGGYRGTSTLGNITAASSSVEIGAGSAETTPPRWQSKTSLILIAAAVVCAMVIAGLIYSVGRKAPDPIKVFQKGCDGGDANSCNNLGVRYEYGDGVAKDVSRAVQLYQKTCDGGNALGCNNLGHMYEQGLGVAKSNVLAAQFFHKGCDLGNSDACANVVDVEVKAPVENAAPAQTPPDQTPAETPSDTPAQPPQTP